LTELLFEFSDDVRILNYKEMITLLICEILLSVYLNVCDHQ